MELLAVARRKAVTRIQIHMLPSVVEERAITISVTISLRPLLLLQAVDTDQERVQVTPRMVGDGVVVQQMMVVALGSGGSHGGKGLPFSI